MKLTLIVCTYMRPGPLRKLLATVEAQTFTPDEVLIIDGSTDLLTREMIDAGTFSVNLRYYKVPDAERGLTRQRNFGVARLSDDAELVAFLDDDIELDPRYFSEIVRVFSENADAVAVGGVSTNEVRWERAREGENGRADRFVMEGWSRRNDLRYRLRERFGLVHNGQPGRIVPFGHERSVGFLPPTGKVYETDFIMGGIAAYRKTLFSRIGFSPFFEGYGLYEDKDFSLRARKWGKVYVNTAAKVEHHHDPAGRPDFVKYGKMVVWNGWRVWRTATPSPALGARFKWWAITLLLAYIRLAGALTGPRRKRAFQDFAGRHLGMFRLLYDTPDMSDV